MNSRRHLLQCVGAIATGFVAMPTDSLGGVDDQDRLGSGVDKTKMRKKYAYNEDWVNDLDNMIVDWKFALRKDIAAIDKLFPGMPESAEYRWREAEDVHCVIRVYRKGGLTANFKTLVIRARPRGVREVAEEKTFQIRNNCFVPVVYSIHPVFGWGDRNRTSRAKALAGEWEFEIDDMQFTGSGKYH